MQTEFEATFLHHDPAVVRQQLAAIGARCVAPERLLKRVVFHPPQSASNTWLRVRHEGDTITMSIKRTDSTDIAGQKEVEITISDFTAGVQFLVALGATQKAYQETKRESWLYNDVQVEIDTWPGLSPFVEIEGPTEAAVQQVAEALGFDYTTAIFGPVGLIYQQELGIPIEVINNQTPEITFENPPQTFEQ